MRILMALNQVPLKRGLESVDPENEERILVVTGKVDAIERLRSGETYDVIVTDHWGFGGATHRHILAEVRALSPNACTVLIVASKGTTNGAFDFVHWHDSTEQSPADLIPYILIYARKHTNASS